MNRSRHTTIGWRLISKLAISLLLLLVSLPSAACRHSANAPAPQTQIKAVSDSKANPSKVQTEIGFATRRKFLDHYDKHGAEFGSISKEEYLRQAQTLRDRAAGGDVLEITRADGVVTRFDKQSGAFLAFDSNLTIRTYFKPNDGENYFRRQAKRPAGPTGMPERGKEDEQ